MDREAKAKLASRLSSALHQAPDHPENFANVLTRQLATHGLHITDVRVAVGDTDLYLAKELQAAKRNAPPTYDNLMDLAAPKLNLKGRSPQRALAEALGIPLSEVNERKRAAIVPRIWFEKVHALPDLDETSAELSPEVKRAIEAMVEHGFKPDDIHQVFASIRTTRISPKQIAALHQQNVMIGVADIEKMRDHLFGHRPDPAARMNVWLSTHLREPVISGDGLFLAKEQADRLHERYKSETRMRKEDKSYARAAEAAEMITRPHRPAGHRGRFSAGGGRPLSSLLSAVFGESEDAASRLSQLTGLSPRHSLDLIKGHNNLPDDWAEFLAVVAGRLPQEVDKRETRTQPSDSLSDRQIAFELASAVRSVAGFGSTAPRS